MQRFTRATSPPPPRLGVVETWTIALLTPWLSQDAREEWLGDLHEARCRLVTRGYPGWAISLMTVGQTVLLAWSLVITKVYDLVSEPCLATGTATPQKNNLRTDSCGLMKECDMWLCIQAMAG